MEQTIHFRRVEAHFQKECLDKGIRYKSPKFDEQPNQTKIRRLRLRELCKASNYFVGKNMRFKEAEIQLRIQCLEKGVRYIPPKCHSIRIYGCPYPDDKVRPNEWYLHTIPEKPNQTTVRRRRLKELCDPQRAVERKEKDARRKREFRMPMGGRRMQFQATEQKLQRQCFERGIKYEYPTVDELRNTTTVRRRRLRELCFPRRALKRKADDAKRKRQNTREGGKVVCKGVKRELSDERTRPIDLRILQTEKSLQELCSRYNQLDKYILPAADETANQRKVRRRKIRNSLVDEDEVEFGLVRDGRSYVTHWWMKVKSNSRRRGLNSES